MSIETEQELLLQAPRRDLDRARRDPATWAELACAAGRDAGGRAFDRNRAARFGVIWALQYDRRDQDLPLLRFLLREHVAYYRDVVPSGLAPDLPLAGFLLAERRHAEDIWLHWQAKSISFDTALGYHLFHLLTPGVTAAVAAVRASTHTDRDRILGSIDPARHTDAAVEEWLAGQRARFPSSPGGETLKTWAYHAARLGKGEASRLFMLKWAENEPRTWNNLNTLQFHLAQLGYVREAVTVQKEAVASASTASATLKASSLLTLARLQQRAGDLDGALHTLQETESTLPDDKSGFGQGAWRHYLKECFLLIPALPDQATARLLLAAASRHLQDVPRLWMDGILPAALTAAEHLHATDLIDRCQALAQAADREREDEISRARRSRL
jgi:hypothetical protein